MVRKISVELDEHELKIIASALAARVEFLGHAKLGFHEKPSERVRHITGLRMTQKRITDSHEFMNELYGAK